MNKQKTGFKKLTILLALFTAFVFVGTAGIALAATTSTSPIEVAKAALIKTAETFAPGQFIVNTYYTINFGYKDPSSGVYEKFDFNVPVKLKVGAIKDGADPDINMVFGDIDLTGLFTQIVAADPTLGPVPTGKMLLNVEAIGKGSKVYVRINKMPSLFGGIPAFPKNLLKKWIVIDNETLESSLMSNDFVLDPLTADPSDPVLTDEQNAVFLERMIKAIFEEAATPVFSTDNKGNLKASYSVELKTLINSIFKAYTELQAQIPELEDITAEEYAILDELKDYTSYLNFSYSVSNKTGMIDNVSSNLTMRSNDGEFDMTIGLNSTLSKAKVSIKKPGSSMTLEKFMQKLEAAWY